MSTQVDPKPKVKSDLDRCWLSWPDETKDERPKIRYVVRTNPVWSKGETDGRFEIANLTEKEMEAIEGFLNGSSYIRCVNGRLHAYDAREPLPDAESDPICGPHWPSNGGVKYWGGLEQEGNWASPGIIITALGAGLGDSRYSGDVEEARRKNQRLVEECGFVCLRSKRYHEGKHWEQWVLHYLEAAKGPLRKYIDSLNDKNLDWKAKTNAVCEYIAQDLGVRFGSLDVTVQRWALQNPD
jgi:hypothetical protein